MRILSRISLALLALWVIAATPARAEKIWYPFEVEIFDPPFNAERQRYPGTYTPLDAAAKPWRICVSIPHLKDEYWIAVNFGVFDEARRLGVALQVFEAGGYGNLETQRQQITDCMATDADGLIVSAISGDGLNDLVAGYLAEGRPVVDLINGLSVDGLTGRSAADYWDMAHATGRYLLETQDSGDGTVRVGWFPGPDGPAWADSGDAGFRSALEGSAFEIVVSARGDTGKTAQGELIEQALDERTDLDFIVGTTVTAEAAVPILRRRGLSDRIKVLAYYYGPGVHRGIGRGQIIAAPSDMQAIEARIAVDMVVRALEGSLELRHVSPKIRVIDRSNIRDFDASTTLPPRGFRPIFSVNDWGTGNDE